MDSDLIVARIEVCQDVEAKPAASCLTEHMFIEFCLLLCPCPVATLAGPSLQERRECCFTSSETRHSCSEHPYSPIVADWAFLYILIMSPMFFLFDSGMFSSLHALCHFCQERLLLYVKACKQSRMREREGDCYQRLPRETTLRGPGPNGAIGEAALHEWAALSMECRGEHLCNRKRASWSLHPLRAYGSPQGYKCRTPGAWAGWKPSAFADYRWIRAMVISIAIIPFLRMRTSGSLH